MRIFQMPRVVLALVLLACQYNGVLAATLIGIPTLELNASSSPSTYSLSSLTSIVVDSQYKDTVDNDGETLIPPTLMEFAKTFSADLATVGINTTVQTATSASNGSIFLTLEPEKGAFLNAAGKFTSEGYRLTVSSSGIIVSGASPLGAWWGTRSILQQVVLQGKIPIGTGLDAPGWGTRGAMLDVGRHYYPPSFLKEICSYLSFFKQNTFHIHLSDNLINNVNIYSFERSMDLYASFRLNSPAPVVDGLVKPFKVNESYTEDVFEDIQQTCAQRGVTVIPEIEAPGHALVIVQWKPQLGLEDLSLLNISNPGTIPTMQDIWRTFLPWFHSKSVHIGADEYDSALANDYNLFVNTMSKFISEQSNKRIRIWGTNEPSKVSSVSKNVTIQHWEFFEDNPFWDLIKNGYTVLNSDDSFYIVGKWSGSYPQQLNLTRIFNGNPAGGAWAPFVFDVNNATNNPAPDEPLLLGHIAAQWNDYGPNATTYSEAYYAWRDGLPALADKQWGGALTLAEYTEIFQTLHSAIPGQNLDRSIRSKSDIILKYDFSDDKGEDILDSSGNGYHGRCSLCTIKANSTFATLGPGSLLVTPLSSKGRDYTLSFSINPSSSAPIGSSVFSGPDSSLLLGNGTLSNVTLVSGNNAYTLNYTLPVDTWTCVDLIGRGNATYLVVNGGEEMEFLAKLGINGASFVWAPIAIEAPLARIGGDGFVGSIGPVELRGSA